MVNKIRTKGSHGKSLSEALGLRTREMISLTGAGGKTTLMFRLAQELFLQGKRVITTTTTKIKEPSQREAPHLYVSEDRRELEEFVSSYLEKNRHLTLATERLAGGKLKGLSSELADILWNSYDMDALIIEADGSAGRPIKAPREWEPVIPSKTSIVVALLGIDGVGKELNDTNVFQPDLVSKLTAIPEGERMTEEGMARLMTHPQGLFKGSPNGIRRMAFLNKVDVPEGIAKARRITQHIFGERESQVERVLWGQLRNEPPVVEIIYPVTL